MPNTVPPMVPLIGKFKNNKNSILGLGSLDINKICEENTNAVKIPEDFIKNYVKEENSLQGKKACFFSKLNEKFFTEIIQKKSQQYEVDHDSLAEVLTGSYLLEEDDLHKDNIGIYFEKIDDNDLKFKIKFFKIDHDLMFTESVLSHNGVGRLEKKLAFKRNFFTIHPDDLLKFPNVRHTDQHHIVNRTRFIKRNLHKTKNKSYTLIENYAFISLKDNADFKKAKWEHWVRQAYFSTDNIKKILEDTTSIEELTEETKNMMEQAKMETLRAAVNRKRLLKLHLLSSPKIKAEILKLNEFKEIKKDYKAVKEGDTAIHVAVRTRTLFAHDLYHSGNANHFKSSPVNQKNSENKTALDVWFDTVISNANENKSSSTSDNPIPTTPTANEYVMLFELLEHGACYADYSSLENLKKLNMPLELRDPKKFNINNFLKSYKATHHASTINLDLIYACLVHYAHKTETMASIVAIIESFSLEEKLIEKIVALSDGAFEKFETKDKEDKPALEILEKNLLTVANNVCLGKKQVKNLLTALCIFSKDHLSHEEKGTLMQHWNLKKNKAVQKPCYALLIERCHRLWIRRSNTAQNNQKRHKIIKKALTEQKNSRRFTIFGNKTHKLDEEKYISNQIQQLKTVLEKTSNSSVSTEITRNKLDIVIDLIVDKKKYQIVVSDQGVNITGLKEEFSINEGELKIFETVVTLYQHYFPNESICLSLEDESKMQSSIVKFFTNLEDIGNKSVFFKTTSNGKQRDVQQAENAFQESTENKQFNRKG